MGATVRRAIQALLVVLMLGGFGATIGATELASAASLPAASSATPGVPASTLQLSGSSLSYCVSNYAPNSDVAVIDQLSGVSKTIHTDATGAGCASFDLKQACSTTVSQAIVATGVDATGKPVTSQATYNAPPDSTLCPPTTSPSSSPTATATCALSSTAILSDYRIPGGSGLLGHVCDFVPNELVYVYVHSAPVFVGSTTADATGVAAKHIMVPACLPPGQHEFIMVGQTSGNVATATFTVTDSTACAGQTAAGGGSVLPVSANGGSGGGSVSGSGGGSLAFTGADIAAMVLVGLVLLALGGALVTVRRRRA
jgi:LPXTG-motif cell wall-anchored protein